MSHLTSGDAIADLQTGASAGVSTSTKGVARREKMQSDLGQQDQQLLSSSGAAALQENVPCQGRSVHPGGDCYVRSLDDILCREIWWFSRAAGPWSDFLDCESRNGCCCIQRFRADQGVHCDPHGVFRAVHSGWQLECCLCSELARGTPSSALHGQDDDAWSSCKAIRAVGAAIMGGNRSVVFEGSRTFVNQEGRDQAKRSAKSQVVAGGSRVAKPKEKTEVFQETCGFATGILKDDGVAPKSSWGSMHAEPGRVSDVGSPPKSKVARSIRLSRESRCEASTPTFFQIPFPVVRWGRMPEKCSAKKRHSIHLSRALFVIVAALNYWHSGGKVSDVNIFQRVPNAVHRRLSRRCVT